MATAMKSEDVLSKKFDVCIADTLIKLGGGLVTGAVFSLFVFKRKTWPIVFGMGAGVGMGYSNCQNRLNQPYLVMADRVKIKSNTQEKLVADIAAGENTLVAEVPISMENSSDTTANTGVTEPTA